MKIWIILSTLLVSSPLFACDGGDHAKNDAADALILPQAHAEESAADGAQKARIQVSGLHCSSCEKMINANLGKVQGVKNVAWDKKKNVVEVTYLKGSTTPSALVSVISSSGDDFKATLIQ